MLAATVLVVDDEPLVREAVADMLKAEGFTALVAGSADEALRILADGARLDLIVSDVRMPQKDGFSLAVEVRATHPQIPFVFITGYMLSPERDAALGRVLWKPFKQKELIEAVEQALGQSR
jgi:two-component system, cell cycle sensor histidine kinase and response regulator CckA